MVYENKEDWPEKFRLDNLVTREEDIEKIISGKKKSVRRNDRYADVGDSLVLNGHIYEVENVFPQFLRNITESEAQDEGYENVESYKDAITSIHEKAVWDLDQLVWAHYLREK